MAIRITSIKTCEGEHENPYVAIDYLEWIDERKKITGATGNKYVKTVTNGAITDGLLLLPQCG
ncbi:MAG TPA: hypothetical protein DCO83_01615 [Mucilaginibacter sp.]|jgi:hypothetical protein|nr:hypothetical protein [Mucilaginibacter sp.]